MKTIIKIILFIWFICTFITTINAQDTTLADPDPQRFDNEIKQFIEWDAKNTFPENALLFTGSSSMRMWPTAEYFPETKVINRGFGGSQISDVNFYYDSVVKKYSPRVVIFYAGDNDINDGKSISQVFEDFKQFSKRLEKDFPETFLLYLPIKPSISRRKLWEKMNKVNMRIKDYCEKNKLLFYVDTATDMLDETGKPKANLFLEDGLHLNSAGYDLWTSKVAPVLRKVLKKTD